jgi:hypothetical protein
MRQQVELKIFTQEEVLLAAETLNTTATGKRQIVLTPAGFAAIEAKLSPLPNSPGLPAGEILPGVGGYLYNIPVFVDSDSQYDFMI